MAPLETAMVFPIGSPLWSLRYL